MNHFIAARSKPPVGDDLESLSVGTEEKKEEDEEYREDIPEVPPSFSSSGQEFKVEVGGDITFPCQVENKGECGVGKFIICWRCLMIIRKCIGCLRKFTRCSRKFTGRWGS